MTAWTYILRCADGTYYVGSTIDLHNRLAAHKQGLGAAYTKRRLPVELVWSCDFERVEDAFALEKSIQGWSHAKGLLNEVVTVSVRPRGPGSGS
ncbi:GIY-YIG nuclease family protein [Microbacterium sp. MEC084]|uniref:GIY-YIG nuclease family protein n=1 Tax=Microbacterium sp. MEC084 TaxID=1963027 RepID=UPI00107018F8|nr:GIY-YIG nuclease family protein [Microbacterium sp. MEC084]MCD1270032.1 GIY-YIG nuclease family protein [Microbacterium sp. MEC084]